MKGRNREEFVPHKKEHHGMKSVSTWKELSDAEKEVTRKKGFDENGGRYMVYCGQYLRGDGNNLDFFGKLARVAGPILALIETAVADSMLGCAAWISYRDGKDLEPMSEAMHFFVMISNMFIITVNFLYYRALLDSLFTSIGAGFFSYGDLIDEDTKRQMDQHIAKMKTRKQLRMKAFGFLVWSCGLILMGKLFVGYVRFGDRPDGEGNTVMRRQIVPLWFPGVGSWPMYLFATFSVYFVQVWVMGTVYGLVLPWIAFVEELTAQLELVGMGLRRLTARARHMYITKYGNGRMNKVKYSKCVEEALKASVVHHTTILEICSGFRRLSSIPLFTVALNSALMLCMQGFMLIEKGVPIFAKATSSLFLFTEILYTYMFFAYSDAMMFASEDIGNQLYLDDWTPISGVVYPYFSFMKLRTSKPFLLTAAGFIKMDLAGFSNVISSSYSYFNLLLSNRK